MVQNKTYTKEELLNLYNEPLSKLLEISHKITSENFDNTVEACSILSAKTGACSENCKYCSQSKHNHAEIECHPLLDIETVKKAALGAKKMVQLVFVLLHQEECRQIPISRRF